MMTPSLRGLHVLQHRLGAEELVPQVHGDAAVPVFGGDVLGPVALVMGGVVDQHRDGSQLLPDRRDGPAQRLHVRQVAVLEAHRGALPGEIGGERLGGGLVDVQEADLGVLPREGPDDGLPDAASAAGHDDHLAGEIGIKRALAHSELLLIAAPHRPAWFQGIHGRTAAKQCAGERGCGGRAAVARARRASKLSRPRRNAPCRSVASCSPPSPSWA